MSLSRGGLLLLAALPILLAPSIPVAAYGEVNFNENLNQTGGVYPVSNGITDAQSFTPWESFQLLRVSVFVRNRGFVWDTLNITIQSDAVGSPSGVVLAWSEFLYTGGAEWRAFTLTPAPAVLQGNTYWIVAANSQGTGDGYDWTHAGADVVPGEAKVYAFGSWNSVPEDFAYQTYGLRLEPSVTLSLDGDRPRVSPGDVETFTVFLNNTGSRAPRGAWLNLTMPSGLTYEADTAGPLGGTRNGTSWYFPNLGNGAHVFFVAASVNATSSRYLNTTARLDYTDSTGVRMPPRSASFSIEATEIIVPPPTNNPPPTSYLWLLPVAVALVPVAAYTYRLARRPSIEEVFVVHNSGVLLYHLGRSMKAVEDKDKDVLGSMFTVVQEFVKESFRYGADRDLNKMEFGDYKILIERGPNLYLAVASSADVDQLSHRVKQAVDEIERTFGEELAQFSGRMERVLGIRDIVKKRLRLA